MVPRRFTAFPLWFYRVSPTTDTGWLVKQELIYLRHTGSCTHLRRHIATSVVGFSRLKGRHASWLPSIQIRFVITQAQQVHDQSAVIMQGMAALTVADSGCLFRLRFGFHFGLSLLSSEFSSETGGGRSHHCLGFQEKMAFCSRETVTFLGAQPSRHLRVQVPFNGYTTDV